MNISRPVATAPAYGTPLPQPASASDVAAISAAASQVVSAVASFNQSNCYETQASAKCYPSSFGTPPPEPWVAWIGWAQTLVGYAQSAYDASQSALAAAGRIAAANPAAWYAWQSVGSSVGGAATLIASAQPMTVPQGMKWESADGSTGQYPPAASWKYDKSGYWLFYPNPTFIGTLSRALSYCQGAIAYAQGAIKQASYVAPTPPPTTYTPVSTITPRVGLSAALPLPVSVSPSEVKSQLASQLNQASANLSQAWSGFQSWLGQSWTRLGVSSWAPTINQAIGYAKTMLASAKTASAATAAIDKLVATPASSSAASAASSAYKSCAAAFAGLPAASSGAVGWLQWVPTSDGLTLVVNNNAGSGVPGVTQVYQYASNAVATAMGALSLSAPTPPPPVFRPIPRITPNMPNGMRVAPHGIGVTDEWGVTRTRHHSDDIDDELQDFGLAQASTTTAATSSTSMIFAALGGAVLGGLLGYIVKPKGYAGAGIGALAGAAGGGILGSVARSSAAAATPAPITNVLPPGPYKQLSVSAKLQPNETYLMSLVEEGGVDLSTSTPADIAQAEAQILPTMQAQGATLLGFWVGVAPAGWPPDSNAAPAVVKSAVFMAAKAGAVTGSIPAGSGINVFATGGLSA